MAPAAFGALATLAAAEALGRLASAALGLALARSVRFLCGAALLHLVVFLLGVTGRLTPAALAASGLAIIGAALVVRTPPAATAARLPRWLWLVLVPYGVVYLAHAAAPEISPDGLAYHVALPQRYLRDAALSFVPHNIYAQLSQGLEMLFTPAIAFGRPASAALVHLAFLAALVASFWNFTRSAAAVLLVFCAPVVGIDATSAYNDVALMAVLVALAAAAQRGDARHLPVIGLLAGFAFALKYTGFVALPYALWSTRRHWRRWPVLLAAATLMIVPWLLRNAFGTGNPVAPFANAWFPNPVFDPELERAYVQSMRTYGPFSNWPLEVTVRGFVLSGLLGPVFLLSPVALARPRWLAAAAFFALPYASNIGTRFLLPALPFLAFAMAQALRRWAAPVAILHAVLCWPWLADAYAHPQAWRIKEFRWRAALGQEPETEFLARRLTEWPMAQTLDRTVQPGERVLTFSQFPDALTRADLVTAPLSRPGVELRQAVWYTHARQFLPTARRRYWFPGEPRRRIRLETTASIADVRLFHLLQPVPATVHSHPAAWDARATTDDTWLTRWSAFGHQHPFLEVEASEPFDRLELITTAGARIEVPGGVEAECTPPVPDGRLAAQAARLLRRHGIRYLLLQDRDYGPALGKLTPARNMEGWPVRLLETRNGLWLFRIESSGQD